MRERGCDERAETELSSGTAVTDVNLLGQPGWTKGRPAAGEGLFGEGPPLCGGRMEQPGGKGQILSLSLLELECPSLSALEHLSSWFSGL